MASKKEEIVIDVRSAVKLEQELQAHVDHGVVLIDVYSAEWGPCKALAETFRALNNDGGAKLRILSAECHSILASIRNPEERNHHRPKNMEAIRETLPEAWQAVFEERAGLAKPFFMIYKEGRRMAAVDGVNTPVIRSVVKDLRTVRQPPENFLSGALLSGWKQHVHRDESEVTFDRFLKGLLPMAEVTEPLTGEERTAMMEALSAKDTKIVTADNFARWVGEDSTISAVFHSTVPEYQVRAAKAKAEREVEEKAQAERDAEAAKQDEDRKAKEEEAAKEEAVAIAETAVSNIERWSKASGMSEAEAKDTPALRESRKALAVQTSEKVPFTAALEVLPADTPADVAAALAQSLGDAPTVSQFLKQKGATVVTVHNIRRAVEKRFASANLLAAGKMACLCLTSTEEEMANYFGAQGLDVLSSTLKGTVATDYPAFALAGVTNGAGDASEGQESLFFTAPAAQITGLEAAEVGTSVIIPPLAPFSTRGTKKVAEGDLTIVLKDTRRAIFTANTTTRPASAVALTAWFGAYEVVAKDEGRIELAFTGIAFDDVLDALSEKVRKSQADEDDIYTAISQLQRAVADKAAASGEAQQPFDEAVVVQAEEAPAAAAEDAEAEEEGDKPAEEEAIAKAESKKATPVPSKKATPVPSKQPTPVASRRNTPVVTSEPVPGSEPVADAQAQGEEEVAPAGADAAEGEVAASAAPEEEL